MQLGRGGRPLSFGRRAGPPRTRRSPAVRLTGKAVARHPVLVAAFEGWNDAGESASLAAAFLAGTWGARVVAEIDPEEFFDFTEVRPEVTASAPRPRSIQWPVTTISLAHIPGGERDALLLRGHEPSLRWKTYCAAVRDVVSRFGVTEVVTLGAYLSEITHNRPVPVSAAASDDAVLDGSRIAASAYEGPTGIVGVLGHELAEAGVPTISLWASVPCYSVPVSPKAALALVRACCGLIGAGVVTSELQEQSEEYERRMDQLVAEDENVAAYVARIEEMEEVVGSDLSAEGLAEEVERFLREKRSR
ncbi:MAG TPA: PAC2 family protein [Acidimicrobiales bacterium]|nr:PAC2 family protein [Acidimicrobiales bacterium]